MPGRWRTLKHQVLLRPIPHTLLCWRFLLPGQSAPVRLHRRVCLGAYPQLPRWQWALILLYSCITWWFFFAWLSIVGSLKKKRREARGDIGVSVLRQMIDLLRLALLHGIPPVFYYQYALYRQPAKRWLNYVYTHELPHWHQAFLRKAGAESLRLITHKREFAEAMAAQGIATVETVAFLPKGEAIGPEKLFRERSLLFKPESGFGGEGIMRLEFDASSGAYSLTASRECFESEPEILAAVAEWMQGRDYLVQPLLENSLEIEELCGMKRLVTLRLVSGLIDGVPTALIANLEVPAEDAEGFRMAALDIETGRLFYSSAAPNAEMRDLLDRVTGKVLPNWREAVAICTKAHESFPDLPTIGWDAVFTDTGVKLLEGNINWGVAALQVTTGMPLLETALALVYPRNWRWTNPRIKT